MAAPTPVCWKTGTSTGYRDAGTFAFNRHYVVGDWLGKEMGQYWAGTEPTGESN